MANVSTKDLQNAISIVEKKAKIRKDSIIMMSKIVRGMGYEGDQKKALLKNFSALEQQCNANMKFDIKFQEIIKEMDELVSTVALAEYQIGRVKFKGVSSKKLRKKGFNKKSLY